MWHHLCSIGIDDADLGRAEKGRNSVKTDSFLVAATQDDLVHFSRRTEFCPESNDQSFFPRPKGISWSKAEPSDSLSHNFFILRRFIEEQSTVVVR